MEFQRIERERPEWADYVVKWAKLSSESDLIIEYLRGIFQFTYPSRMDMIRDGQFVKSFIKEAFTEEEKAILEETGLFSKKNTNTERKLRKNALQCKLRRLFDRLVNEIFGYIDVKKKLEIEFDQETSKSSASTSTCHICATNQNNVQCENGHKICHFCYATICVKNKGSFLCPQCRNLEVIVDKKQYDEWMTDNNANYGEEYEEEYAEEDYEEELSTYVSELTINTETETDTKSIRNIQRDERAKRRLARFDIDEEKNEENVEETPNATHSFIGRRSYSSQIIDKIDLYETPRKATEFMLNYIKSI